MKPTFTVICSVCIKDYTVRLKPNGRRQVCRPCNLKKPFLKETDWLSPLKASFKMNITHSTLKVWVEAGKIKTRPNGRSYVVYLPDIERAINEGDPRGRAGRAKNNYAKNLSYNRPRNKYTKSLNETGPKDT